MTDNEFDRYLAIRRRTIGIDLAALRPLFEGAPVVVTGGTGQVGSCLLPLLQDLGADPIVSISRGITPPVRKVEGVEYLEGDVRDADQISAIIDRYRPQAVFHLAAQREPGLAEYQVPQTIETNVTGTLNVMRACTDSGVRSFVYASTGKTVRLFTPGVYASSKKIAESMVADAWTPDGPQVGMARFTHIVDNSILLRRIRDWIDAGDPIRLHGRHIHFYAQSAVESAELLLSCARPRDYRPPTISAITDLGWPVGLVDLSQGALERHRSDVPLMFVGMEQGYDDAYPGLYDPRTAGDHSPLINAMEAARVVTNDGAVEGFAAARCVTPLAPEVGALLESAAGGAPDSLIREQMRDVGLEILRRESLSADPEVVRRMVRYAGDPADMPEAEQAIHRALCAAMACPPAEAGI